MSSANRRIDELDSPLNTSTELEKYLSNLQRLCKDLYVELQFGAELLQQNLATLPVADARYNGGMVGSATSRIRAKRVANNLRRAAEAAKFGGGQAVKTWREFTRAFAPEIEQRRRMGTASNPQFKVDN
jgi:hypothetical protein